jgi:hypothetical protein
MIPIILLYALTLWQGGPPPPGDPWWCTATGQTFIAHNPVFKGDDKGCKAPFIVTSAICSSDCATFQVPVSIEGGDCLMVGPAGTAYKIPCGCGGDPTKGGGGTVGPFIGAPPPAENRQNWSWR